MKLKVSTLTCGRCGADVEAPPDEEITKLLVPGHKTYALVGGCLFLQESLGPIILFMVRCEKCVRPGSLVEFEV